MTAFPYTLDKKLPPPLGLIVLQADETIESDFRRLTPTNAPFLVSRIPSSAEVTLDTLSAMEARLTAAAAVFPRDLTFGAIGYGCTSATAQIGAERISERILAGASARAVVDPVGGLVAACEAMGVGRLAFLSPYIEDVSTRLRQVLAEHGVATPVFGAFNEAREAAVARISSASIFEAAKTLARDRDVDALFLSCTNLRTLDVIAALEEELRRPVFSSNQVLAWRMLSLSGQAAAPSAPGALFRRAAPALAAPRRASRP